MDRHRAPLSGLTAVNSPMDQTLAAAAPRRANPFAIASLVAGVVLFFVGTITKALALPIPMLMAETGISFSVIPLGYGGRQRLSRSSPRRWVSWASCCVTASGSPRSPLPHSAPRTWLLR